MKERPILFSSPMVRALLAGTKTQTRRIINFGGSRYGMPNPGLHKELTMTSIFDGRFCASFDDISLYKCPYGQTGDRLWVRETWGKADDYHIYLTVYRATDDEKRLSLSEKVKWRPSIHMPRWASRITLEVTSVRVERLQEIREADCVAEGIERRERPGRVYYMHSPGGSFHATANEAYKALWESISGEGSWHANPWVWVVEFKRVKP